MTEQITNITAKDCSLFCDKYADIIHKFATRADQFEQFRFKDYEEKIPLAQLDHRENKWRAGRLVGEAYFSFKGEKYKIEISPRFGEKHLFRMLEEIFNVRLTDSRHSYDNSESKHQLVRKLISLVWLNLLSKGNRYGLPRSSKDQIYYGNKIRGRMNVRSSLIPMKTEQKVVSTYRQKKFDDRIVKLLKGAYEILLSDYYLGKIKQPYNAKHALDQLNRISYPIGQLTKREYKRIKVKRIYKPFKPVIDLSWDIIKNNREASQEKGTEQSFSYFIDMAEIWEMYLKSLLKRRLSQYGWELWKKEIATYPDKFFERGLVPDIVFHRNGKLLVFDAKYKMMKFRPKKDVDRSDFFQIHTYIQYFQQKFDVIAGGLLYPFSKSFNEEKQKESLSLSLFGEGESDTKFLIGGIDLDGCQSKDFDFKLEEQKFLNRIVSYIE